MKTSLGLISILIIFPLTSNAIGAPKYKATDCITPITNNYSWFGKYARVEAFSKIEGFPKKNYILSFPTSISNSVIFGQEIENNTKRVNQNFCTQH